MKKITNIVTPILQTNSFSFPDFYAGGTSQEKVLDGELDRENGGLKKIPNSTSFQNLIVRRNSAFSLFSQSSIVDSVKEEQSYLSSLEIEECGKPRRCWKREKRNKRQMNRLETKNLNRYFRSKINELLRDIKETGKLEDKIKAEQILDLLNKSNQIMFSEIRQIMKDKWLQENLTCCSAGLLKYIHRGKMGMQSKLIMLKYYNKIMKAIRMPENFTCWK